MNGTPWENVRNSARIIVRNVLLTMDIAPEECTI
jgi:hypothetical protein